MTPIFLWNGAYAGFLEGGWFFDLNGRYIGWLEQESMVWRSTGSFLGELVDDNYILRTLAASPPVPKPPRVPPVPPTPPTPPGVRIPRAPRPGWVDPLEALFRMPSLQDLIGEWRDEDKTLGFGEHGKFVWSAPGEREVAGCWTLNGQLISVFNSGGSGSDPDASYRIIEYTGDTLHLRWHTQFGRSLLFRLYRA